MISLTTFDSTKELLQDLLTSIKEGKTQLPDFQRDWVWDDEHIRSLLASISLSYPVGAVMMLQTGNADVRFKPRTVEGVGPSPVLPDRLILDGQQRLTSLFQSLVSGKSVATRDVRGHAISRWYYIDMAQAIDPNGDRDDAIIGVPENRITRNFRNEILTDYSTIEKECAADMFPVHVVFHFPSLMNWQMQYVQADPAHTKERFDRWNLFVQNVVQRFQQYQVPVIILRKETPKEAVCQVFEKVNTGGVSLNVFQLLTATYAVDNYDLRDNWDKLQKRLKKQKVLGKVENTDVLQAVTLLATRERRVNAITGGVEPDKAPGISCKRKDVLNLTVEDYQTWIDPLALGFEKAAWLLQSEHIFAASDLPYQSQLPALASICAILKDKADTDGVRRKLLRWYWCGVFGELYGGSTESRLAKDLPEVLGWIDGGPEPDTISASHFAPSRLLGLRTRNSAAYKGIYALLLGKQCIDPRTGYAIDLHNYFDDQVDIHHIFPQAWCSSHGIGPLECDSVINKTPISAKTNRMMGGDAPSRYLARLEKAAGVDEVRMNEFLQTHVVDHASLRDDDFNQFFEMRRRVLLEMISKATGKTLLPMVAEPDAPVPTAYQDEEDNAA